MRFSILLLAAATCLTAAAMPAHAALFVSTDQSGGNIQCDINHTPYWTYSVSNNVSDIDGGRFVMKDGPATTQNITFTIFEGTIDDYPIATPLLSVTLTPADFTNQYAPVLFQGAPFDLLANTVYTAVLASSAADPQNSAYFIKSGNLEFVDGTGTPTDPGGEITPNVPEPGTLTLAALGVATLLARRRK